MNLFTAVIEVMEPRTVMAVGTFVAFAMSSFLAFQAYMNTGYRWSLSILSLSLGLGGLSLTSSVILFDDHTFRHTILAVLTGMASYGCGMYALILLYRPSFSRVLLVVAAMIAFSGYAIWPTGIAARNWNNICQFLMASSALFIVAQAKDELAPKWRWLTIGLCAFSALGMLPRLLSLFQTGIDPGLAPLALDTNGYRIRALIFAVSPAIIYAVLTGVIHARIASKLKRAVDLDVLTGAFSRRYLFESGEAQLQRRVGDQDPNLSVLLIDVDHFKKVNDQWGHAVGDEVLKYLVRQVKDVIRSSDSIISRYGGEEFVVLVPTKDIKTASLLAERILAHVKANPFRLSELQLTITVSIGVAGYKGAGTLDGLINEADECLYRAKRAGRDQVVSQSNLLVPV
jgi:diguanylate cyclase (GGDEF)-like protein